MIELDEALQQILAALPAPPTETVRLTEAAGRILAGTVHSGVDLPPFDNSAMDGYALRAADVSSAAEAEPVKLQLRGRIAAGEVFRGELGTGECVRLFTGSPLPGGADAVVMQEDTRVVADQAGEVLVCDPVRPGENVRLRGSDVKRLAVLAAAGSVLDPGKLSLLAATGVADVRVGQQPRVGLLATGSELCEAGSPLASGQIYESNRVALAELIRRAGGLPEVYPLVPDDLAATRHALQRAVDECDMVVTSGGVSVGEMDFVKTAWEQLGGTLEFWKVAMRPGKPFVFGRWRDSYLFGLPGNPVSAFVTFLLLVRPALLRWQGATDLALPAVPGVLTEPLANPGERRHFVRVTVNSSGEVRSAGLQASHALASLAVGNGLVDLAPRSTLAKGSAVKVLCWS
ncbi:MAG: molybdopterin molybdotransferase MoeA [Verrucomicrobia bacterium]|nr:molybdopterin molybdotransferase MoeA [Verrucomicrobiota bacterium]